LIVKVQQIYTC